MATRRHPPPIDPEYEPDVAIAILPSNAPVGKILTILERDGGVILEDFVDAEELKNIDKIEESTKEGDDQPHTGFPQIPTETRVVSGLVGRSKTVAGICEGSLLTSLREEILTDHFSITCEQFTDQYRIDPS